jgi:hypothetical protein
MAKNMRLDLESTIWQRLNKEGLTNWTVIVDLEEAAFK